MIYCVVPEVMTDELYEKLVRYYETDDNVTVIIDRRTSSRRAREAGQTPEEQQRQRRDRRRARVPGEFPDTPVGDSSPSDD
jgi:hypothetical protein